MPEYEDLQETYPGAGTFKLGHDAESCRAQVDLIRKGGKRAVCAALADFEDAPEAMPVEGRTDIIALWNNTPALVVKTVKVQQIRYCDVNTNMAHSDLGRDDFTAWRKATKNAIKRDHKFDPEMMLVFEFFQLVEDLDGRQIEPRS
ncbi:ASCH domain-containing protein [Octadecabacter sp. G9-8]|uniref:ASCH domain-containing protein n=1 Tax=Octadecabacter dasysiphoniae TaxID=2909341 RepID=A0ABS9CV50_9RHOB|nr:ASCH domain-containing protein [Octadecabacter dasysiphoniae]MCF2871133.1 ASCH domain-containing protein [Octadecabacter dasysiphoniae]